MAKSFRDFTHLQRAICLKVAVSGLFSCPKQLNRWPCHWLTQSGYFYFCHTKSDPRDLWRLRHLIRVTRRHDLTIFGNFLGGLFWNIFWDLGKKLTFWRKNLILGNIYTFLFFIFLVIQKKFQVMSPRHSDQMS